MQMSARIMDQIRGAYLLMVERAGYAPSAPSDGWGNITVPDEELDHEGDSLSYAVRWWEQEEERTYWLGCPDMKARPAFIHAVEGAHCISGTEYGAAVALLRLAADELEEAAG